MRILFYGETPVIETGAGRVNRHLLDTIIECGHSAQVLGTSHFMGEEYDHERYPFPIVGVEGPNQVETHKKAGDMMKDRDGTFDVLFISADMHVPNILIDHVRHYPSIVLAAIDGPVVAKEQVASLGVADWPAVYSKYSYNQVKGVMPDCPLMCITLGCEPDVFYPVSKEVRREYRKRAFGLDEETFLVMWANRNQMRKDPARAMYAFHLFHKQVPNSRLYMHARMQDVGGSLPAMATLLGIRTAPPDPEVMFSPPEYNEVWGFEREKLNLMYNAADVGISTSQGEGWGLTTTEFMAAGTPFIGPDNTTFREILGGPREIRGYLSESGGDDLWSVYYGTDDAPRPITSCTALAKKIHYVYEHRDQARRKAVAAREWTEQHTWEHMREQWKKVLYRASDSLQTTSLSEANMGI